MTLSRLFATLALVTCLAVVAFAPSAVAAPATDNFADAGAIDITGTRGVTVGDIFGATRETGEPTVSGSNTAHTMWWRYVPAQNGFAKFSTCAPAGQNPMPDSSLGVYIGSPVTALTPVAQGSDNCPNGWNNAVAGPFPVTAGNYYWVQIGAANSLAANEGDFNLTLDFNAAVPANDNWASATTISGSLPQTFAANNGLATVENNEPLTTDGGQRSTLWYSYTAPSTGIISIDTCSSVQEFGMDSEIAVFSGNTPSAIDDINYVDSADGGCSAAGADLTKLFVSVNSGTKYWIKLANYANNYGFPYVLRVKQVTAPDFSLPPVIDTSSPVRVGTQATGYDATWAPTPATTITRQWRRCDTAGLNCVNIAGATSNLYTPTSADIGSTLIFRNSATNGSGTTNADSAPSNVVDSTPANDAWASATNLGSSSSVDLADDNNWASRETGEPSIATSAPWNTVWYRWTAPSSGNWWVDNCLGGGGLTDSLDLLLGVRTGGSGTLASTTSAGGADNGCGPFHPNRTSTQFSATVGTVYWFQVGSKSQGQTGSYRLRVRPATTAAFETSPSLTGDALVGSTLTLDLGDWTSPTTATPVVRWFKCDASGNNCVDNGSSGNLYTIPVNYGGGTVKATVSLTNSYGTVSDFVLSAVIPADSDGDGVNDAFDDCPTDPGVRANGCNPSVIVAAGAPVISGTFVSGQAISSTTGDWNVLNDPLGYAVTYQWQRCATTAPASCSDIPGATPATYSLTLLDAGSYVRVIATATNSDDSESQPSAISELVSSPPAAPAVVTAPVVSGAPIVGETLTTTDGTWTPGGVSLTREWLRCDDTVSTLSCTEIPGASDSTYVLQAADLTKYIRSQVTASNVTGDATEASAPTAVITGDSDGDGVPDVTDACPAEPGTKPNGCLPSDVVAVSPPVLSGTFNVGDSVSTDNGAWQVLHDQLALSFAYQWQRCDTASAASCSDISGATSSSRTLQAADYGKRTRVRVTASNADDADSQFSAISAAISQAPANSVPPSVTGTTTVGQTLTGNQGTWTPGDALLTNQWLRCDTPALASCSVIAGETGSTYLLVAADDGKLIRLAVEANTAAGTEDEISNPTAAVITDTDNDGVADGSDACPGETGTKPNGCLPSDVSGVSPPMTSGVFEVGELVSTDNGAWNVLHDQLPLLYSFQWQRCSSTAPASCSDISGATSNTRTLVAADYGNYTRVRVTASNADDSDFQYSAISAQIWQRPTNQVAPSITGVPGVGDVLTGQQGTWTPAAAALTNEWLRCDDAGTSNCAPISGETGTTYTTTGADLHKFIRFSVTATTPLDDATEISASTSEIVADVDGDGVDDIDDTCPADPGSKPNGCDPSVIVGTGVPVISGDLTIGRVLTTTDGAWEVQNDPLGYTVTYQWQSCTSTDGSSCSDLAGHTSDSYTLQSAEYGQYMRVIVTATNADDSETQASAITSIVSDVPTYSSPPSITGQSRVSVELVGDRGIWDPADTTFEYEWLRCTDNLSTASCAPISGETASFYTLQPADDGSYLRFRVIAETTSGTATIESDPTDVVFTDSDEDGVHDADDTCPTEPGSKANGCEPSEIFSASPPVVTGTLEAGETLSTSDGTWNVIGEQLGYGLSYEWLVCGDTNLSSCNGVSGETSSTFTIPTGVFGNYVRSRVIASNADDTTDAYSAPVGPTDEDPYKVYDPSISGTTDVGSTLSGYDGEYGPSNVSIDRVWLRCDDPGMIQCTQIGGATDPTYTLVADDYTKYIVLRVHVSNGVGDLYAFSPVTAQIGAGILDTDGDSVLNADDACPADYGDGRPNGCPASVIQYGSDPTISGNLLVGDSLTVSAGGWTTTGDPLPLTYSYAWDICGTSNPITCVSTGSTGSSYLIASGDYGRYVRVTESVSNADDSDSATSAIYGPIEQEPTNTLPPSISGITAAGELLTASSGTWEPFDVSLGHSWLRCDDTTPSNCVAIGGETSTTFTPSAADIGKYIRVRVTGTTSVDSLAVDSAPVGPITAAPVDTDGDGVFDGPDACPTEFGDGRPNGCPPSDISNLSAPTLSGTFNVSETISTSNGTWGVTGDQLGYTTSYAWERCDTTAPASCSTIPGASASNYTLVAADYGKHIRSSVSASNADDSATQESAISAAVSQIPVNNTPPAITGSPSVGQTLAGSQGTWTPADATLSNQWMSCTDNVSTSSCSPISGETGSTYTLVVADDLSYIRLRVRASTSAGPTTEYSAATAQVTSAPVDTDSDGVDDPDDACPTEAGDGRSNGCPPSDIVGAGAPTITGGPPEVSDTVSTTDGAWNVLHDQLGFTATYQWQRCDTTSTASCSNIGGATSSSYTLTGADYGKRVRSVVTAANADDSASQASAISSVVSQVPVNNTAPSISGTAQVGSSITASQGTWTPGDATLTNVWLRCTDLTPGSCSPIGGQAGSTYTLAAGDLTHYIRLEVTATTTAGTDNFTTAPIGPVALPDADGDGVPDASDACPADAGDGRANGCPPSVVTGSSVPVISGTLQTGSLLSSTTGNWNVDGDQLPLSFARQWQRCADLTPASCSDIASATGSTYTLVTADIGNHIRVRVTASNADDSATQDSAITATQVVPAPPPVNTVLPEISGAAQVGQLLSTSGGDWTPVETVRTYEWLRCDDSSLALCTPITGATSGGYQLSAADLGKFIRVRVTGSANAMTDIAVSNSTAQVAEAPVNPGGPTNPIPNPTNPASIIGPKKGKLITVRVDRKGRIYISRVSVYCMMESRGDCSGEVKLTARVGGRTRSIGGFKIKTLRGGGRTLRIKLSSGARSQLRQRSSLSANLSVSYKSPGFTTSRYSAKVKIKR